MELCILKMIFFIYSFWGAFEIWTAPFIIIIIIINFGYLPLIFPTLNMFPHYPTPLNVHHRVLVQSFLFFTSVTRYTTEFLQLS